MLYNYDTIDYRWLQVNVPMYYSKVHAALAPVVATVGQYLVRLEENTRESRHALTSKVS